LDCGHGGYERTICPEQCASDDAASSRCELVAYKYDGSAIAAYTVGWYSDRLTKRGGAWMFQHRHMTVNTPTA